MNFHISEEMKENLESFCEDTERNMSEAIRFAIKNMLGKNEK